MRILLFFVAIIISTIFVPQYVIILVLLNLFIGLFLSCCQIFISFLPLFRPRFRLVVDQVPVSIFVPAYNEPPTILMQTLETLSHLAYKNFEVIVIDNNTKSEKIWKPVQLFIKTLGPNFKFYHVNPLSGFKAGALNYLMDKMNHKSKYVAVIDADYLVRSDFITTGLSFFSEKDIALVQFPQHYRNSPNDMPLVDEYGHFFGIYMNMANHFGCVPSTGTVSIYRTDVLKKIGGFRNEILTEDADIGLRIYEAGFKGVYVDLPLGYGLMPYDLESYKKQKWRWVYGNAQSIITLFSLLGKISLKSWFGFFIHLTAWNHLNFLPFAVIAAYVIIFVPIFSYSDTHRFLFAVASLSLMITLISKRILFWVFLKNHKNSVMRSWRVFFAHMGITLIYSEAWLSFIFKTTSFFERTNKFINTRKTHILKNTYIEMLLASWFFIGFVESIFLDTGIITIVTFLISTIVLLSVFYLQKIMSPNKDYSVKILTGLKKKYETFLIDN